MTELSDLVQAGVDWRVDLPDRPWVSRALARVERSPHDPWAATYLLLSDGSLSAAMPGPRQVLLPSGKVGAEPRQPKPPDFRERFLDELHRLLCKADDATYEEERTKLVEQFKVGQAGLVGAITTALVPHVGVGATFLGPGVAAALLIIGRVGLGTWCVGQSTRQAASIEHRASEHAAYAEYQRWRSEALGGEVFVVDGQPPTT